jgi:hypothetical protein
MLARPGSSPGPSWMRNLSELATTDPRQLRRKLLWIFVFFGILQVGSIIVADIAAFRAPGRHDQPYNSPIQVAGLPLISVGVVAHGVIAVGGVATGVIAIGGVTAGAITLGGLSMGLFAFGGVSLAVMAFAGVAIGWRAVGAVAIGNAAFGALAIGRYAYAGDGVAFGRDEANGKQKESLFG